jgi:hypothetical protein
LKEESKFIKQLIVQPNIQSIEWFKKTIVRLIPLFDGRHMVIDSFVKIIGISFLKHVL